MNITKPVYDLLKDNEKISRSVAIGCIELVKLFFNKGFSMKYQDVVEAWNDQADEFNQWCELDEEEKINFAINTSLVFAANQIVDDGNPVIAREKINNAIET